MQIVIYSNLRKLSTLEGLIIEKHKEKEENRAKTLRKSIWEIYKLQR